MRTRRLVLLALFLMIGGSIAEAQGIAHSFDELKLLVKPGDTVSVINALGWSGSGLRREFDSSPSTLMVVRSRAVATTPAAALPTAIAAGWFERAMSRELNEAIEREARRFVLPPGRVQGAQAQQPSQDRSWIKRYLLKFTTNGGEALAGGTG